MNTNLRHIGASVAEEMTEFEHRFGQSVKTRVILLDKIMSYILKRKGKKIRPLFVLLSAAATGKITESTYRGASMIELLHTATLVHDDVVDESDYRRGFFSINAVWKNKIAVLAGDFLLSKGLLISLENNDFELLKITSEAVREMSEGELLQIGKTKKLNITESVYYEIIQKKTASLLRSCCKVGASSGGADAELVKKMGELGENVGMAFQIKDDIFDYDSNFIGKPKGIDIKEKKITLPLIYALSQSSSSEVKEIKSLVKKAKKKPEYVKQVITFVVEKDGINYAQEVLQGYITKAHNTLRVLPDSAYKESLTKLIDYTTKRKK